ncbi:MAG TPA: translesion error-prone DNA polymerase V autoproteolytic subunit [Bacteroidales bacterium]|nr:translesion error-prone DNA polymerase V autoproteolytic subunit [Bacteroidales bacterium]
MKTLYKNKNIEIYEPDISQGIQIPFFGSHIPAGFPSPADDYLEMSLDLNEHLIRNPSSTFFARVTGSSMINSGIYDNDIVIIDKSLQPKNGSILVCVIDGEFTIKRFKRVDDNTAYLMPDNPNFKPIKVDQDNNFTIWGVVTYNIHKHI